LVCLSTPDFRPGYLQIVLKQISRFIINHLFISI